MIIRSIVAAALLFASALSAQTLVTGTWQGEVTMHGEQPTVSAFRVQTLEADGHATPYAITLFHNERPYPFEALRFEQGNMLFSLDTGMTYRCRLTPGEAGGYRGQCRHGEDAASARHITISMTPPAAAQPDTDEEYEASNPAPAQEP